MPGPAIIGYDDNGNAMKTSQPTLADKGPEMIDVDWTGSLETYHTKSEKIATAYLALRQAHKLMPQQKDLVQVSGRSDDKGPFVVKTKTAVPKYGLKLLPLPYDLASISDKQGSGALAGIPIEGLGVYVNVSVKRSSKATFLPPFWLIRRSTDASAANVHLQLGELSSIHSVSDPHQPSEMEQDTPTTQVGQCCYPFLTNLTDLAKDTELVAFAAKEEKGGEAKERSWLDNQKKKG